ncbi:tetratricopeptide repeat (TPR)-like superfamily protein [Wolffia australiana]
MKLGEGVLWYCWRRRAAFYGRPIIRSFVSSSETELLTPTIKVSAQDPHLGRSSSYPDSEEQQLRERRDVLSLRVEKLPKGRSVLSAFQRWMGEGLPILRSDILQAINRLRRLSMNKRALEVMEWVMRERPYKLKDLDYAHLLEFTIKLHGISSGEELFSRIPSIYQNELLYNSLVMACLDRGVVRLSLEYMKKMRELTLPISPFVYNRLVLTHSSPPQRKTISKILTQMRADNVPMHTSTFNILLKMEADEHNIEGLSKRFAEMKKSEAEPNEVTFAILAMAHAAARLSSAAEAYVQDIESTRSSSNWSTLDVLLILYGCLRKERELERTWKAIQALPHVGSQSYSLAVEAFGRAGRVDRSEEIWTEMRSTRLPKSTKEFNSMISVYCRAGILGETVKLLKEMALTGCDPNAITFRHVALGCLRAGRRAEAMRALDMGVDRHVGFRVRRSTPWLEATQLIVEELAEVGELERAKILFREFKECRYSRHAFVHNALIKAHIKAKAYDSTLLRNMILCGARPDAETYSLVRLMEQFKS